MLKKILIVGAILLVGAIAVKKMNCSSYVRTAWSQVAKNARDQIPSQFELERIRHEIAALERDVDNLIKPIAERMYDVRELRKEVSELQQTLAARKDKLQVMTNDWEAKKSFVVLNTKYSGSRAEDKLHREFVACRRIEKTLESKERLLSARERQMEAIREQAEKLISKKREFEVRLAELEAEEELLTVDLTGTMPSLDSSRATAIQDALNQVERRQQIKRNELELRSGQFSTEERESSDSSRVNVDEIRSYLHGQNAVPQEISTKK